MAFTFVGYFVGRMMEYRGVGLVTLIWAGLVPVLALVTGYYAFGERFTFWQLVGSVLILAGVMMVEWPQPHRRPSRGIHEDQRIGNR